jgi:hypothetical protein
MGGFGSGRRYGKNCTDDMNRLDVRKLQRDGCLSEGMSYPWQWSRGSTVVATVNVTIEINRVLLNYRYRRGDGEWQEKLYPVLLERTPCRYGGERVWWRCPGFGCGRRVAVLFGGAVYACRHCHQLAYRSQRETPEDRATRHANKLRVQLGWKKGIFNPTGCKPKGMHWRTYWRLLSLYEVQLNESLTGIMQSLGFAQERLDAMDARFKRVKPDF